MTGIKRYVKTLTAYVEAIGFLGPNFMAADCVWFGDDDIMRFAPHGCSVSHSLGSNMRLESCISPVREMFDIDMYAGIGTVGSNCSDHQSMFEAMFLARTIRIAKLSARVATWVERLWEQLRKLQPLADGISSFSAGSLQEPYDISQLCGCADAVRIAAFQVEPV